jgi:RNA polymerase sigma factor (sigma-70 family)
MRAGPRAGDQDRSGPDVTALYRQHADGLRGLAYLMTGVREAAEEIVHDAFVRVHGRYAALDAPVAYLRTTVVNLCLDWQRRSAMERQRTVGLVERPAGPVEIDETWDLLAELPQDQRVALVLRYYEDLPIDEIARLMDCAPVTVRTRIHRAITRLRKEMTP